MTCIIVTGYPRSGQSLMMQILKEVGIYIGEAEDIETTADDIDPAGLWWHKKVAGMFYGFCAVDSEKVRSLVNEFRSKSDVYAWKMPAVRSDMIDAILQYDSVKVILCYRNYRKIVAKYRKVLSEEFAVDVDEKSAIRNCLVYYYSIVKFLKERQIEFVEVNTEKIDVKQLARFIGADNKRLNDAIKRVMKPEWL